MDRRYLKFRTFHFGGLSCGHQMTLNLISDNLRENISDTGLKQKLCKKKKKKKRTGSVFPNTEWTCKLTVGNWIQYLCVTSPAVTRISSHWIIKFVKTFYVPVYYFSCYEFYRTDSGSVLLIDVRVKIYFLEYVFRNRCGSVFQNLAIYITGGDGTRFEHETNLTDPPNNSGQVSGSPHRTGRGSRPNKWSVCY